MNIVVYEYFLKLHRNLNVCSAFFRSKQNQKNRKKKTLTRHQKKHLCFQILCYYFIFVNKMVKLVLLLSLRQNAAKRSLNINEIQKLFLSLHVISEAAVFGFVKKVE